jgi:hypothetical protein
MGNIQPTNNPMTFSCTKCGSRTPTRGCDLCAESDDEQRDRERAEDHDFQSRREWDGEDEPSL